MGSTAIVGITVRDGLEKEPIASLTVTFPAMTVETTHALPGGEMTQAAIDHLARSLPRLIANELTRNLSPSIRTELSKLLECNDRSVVGDP